MSKGNVKKFKKDKGYESLNRMMLQDEENLSLAAIGLLANLTSYPDTWNVHKTELYTRFAKSGRRVVERAWNELVENNYIVQLKKRNGSKFDYIYYHSQIKFTEEDIKEIEKIEGVAVWDGKLSKRDNDKVSSNVQNVQSKENDNSTVRFEQYKMNCTKRTDNRLTIKEINYKDKDIDTVDTENSSYPQYPQKVNSKVKTKEQYMNDAFYQNAEKVPEEISSMLKAFFGNDIERAESSYQTILRAKKKVEDEIGAVIWLEHDLETIQVVIQSFSLAIRKVERESVVSNPEGYIYTSVYNALANHYKNFNLSPNLNAPYYNWLEEEDTY